MQVDRTWQLVRDALHDESFARKLEGDVNAALEEVGRRFPGIPDKEREEVLEEFFVASAVTTKLRMRERAEEHARVREMSEHFRKGLVDVIEQIGAGYNRVMWMYTIAFYAGLALVFGALFVSLVMREYLVGMVFGGLGIVDVVALFVLKPANELQKSRGNLAQLQAAFFNWANDVRTWNAYLDRVDVTSPGKPPFEEFERVSKRLLDNTERMMDLIQTYCEEDPKKTPAKRSLTPNAPAPPRTTTRVEDPPSP